MRRMVESCSKSAGAGEHHDLLPPKGRGERQLIGCLQERHVACQAEIAMKEQARRVGSRARPNGRGGTFHICTVCGFAKGLDGGKTAGLTYTLRVEAGDGLG
jgi:hypothetical protein